MRYDGTNGIVIMQFRRRLGLTQKELAADWKVSPKTINCWENNKRIPSTSMQLMFINNEMEK